jgi:hypothetical protein
MMILGETVGGRFRPFVFPLISFPKLQNSCSKQRRCRAKARRYVQTHWDVPVETTGMQKTHKKRGRLTLGELNGRLRALKELAAGKLRPALPSQEASDDRQPKCSGANRIKAMAAAEAAP